MKNKLKFTNFILIVALLTATSNSLFSMQKQNFKNTNALATLALCMQECEQFYRVALELFIKGNLDQAISVIDKAIERDRGLTYSFMIGRAKKSRNLKWKDFLLVHTSIDPEKRKNSKVTGLHLVAGEFDLHDFALDLINNAENIDIKDEFGYTPLHIACHHGNLKVVELLLNKEADIYASNNGGFTPLHIACAKGYTDILDLFVKKFPNLNINAKSDLDGFTLLHYACDANQAKIVKRLLELNADAFMTDSKGLTPIDYALSAKNTNALDALIQHLKRNRNTNSELNTLLNKRKVIACFASNLDSFVNILKYTPEINQQFTHELTLLHIACKVGSTKIAQYLIKHGANLEVQDDQGETPLITAAYNGRNKIIKALLSNNKNLLEQVDSSNLTPLAAACAGGHTETVKLLLQKNANVNAKSSNCQTPLHLACEVQNNNIINLLLSKGANINAQNYHGHTPLHTCLYKKNIEGIKILLKHNADPMVTSYDGLTPLEIGYCLKNDEITQAFKEAGLQAPNLEIIASKAAEAIKIVNGYISAKADNEKTSLKQYAEEMQTKTNEFIDDNDNCSDTDKEKKSLDKNLQEELTTEKELVYLSSGQDNKKTLDDKQILADNETLSALEKPSKKKLGKKTEARMEKKLDRLKIINDPKVKAVDSEIEYKVLKLENMDLPQMSKKETEKLHEKLEQLKHWPNGLDIESVKSSNNLFRVRHGKYRILVCVDTHSKCISVMAVDLRAQIYKEIEKMDARAASLVFKK